MATEELIIDYGKKVVWCSGNIPTIYVVRLWVENDKYYLKATLIQGTSVGNFADDEKQMFHKVLDLENKQIDFENIEPSIYNNDGINPTYTLYIK